MPTSKTAPYKGYTIAANILKEGVSAKINATSDLASTADHVAGVNDGQMIMLRMEAPKSDWDAEHMLTMAITSACEEIERRFALCDKPLPH